MRVSEVSKRYAKALLAVTKQKGVHTKALAELKVVAQALSTDAKKSLETKISGVLKKKIVLTFQQDPKLLGGVVADVGGWTFDDSIDTHLKKLNEELNRRAN